MPSFLGIAFPFQVGSTAFPAPVYDADLIKQSIIQILLTTPGERVFRPDFGSNIQAVVFENTGSALVQMVRATVLSAITKWEPRVIIQAIEVNTVDTTVYVDIDFVINYTSQPDTLRLALNAA